MRNWYLSLGLLFLSVALQVTSRPLSRGAHGKRAPGDAGRDGWPRVDGGRRKGCKGSDNGTSTVAEVENIGDTVSRRSSIPPKSR